MTEIETDFSMAEIETSDLDDSASIHDHANYSHSFPPFFLTGPRKGDKAGMKQLSCKRGFSGR